MLNGRQFQQQSMFSRAGDLADPENTEFHDQEWTGDGTYEQLRDEKVWEARQPWDISNPQSFEERQAAANPEDEGYYRPHGAGVADSIAQEGIRKPVELSQGGSGHRGPSGQFKDYLREGHHRVFAAADIDPDMEVPHARPRYNSEHTANEVMLRQSYATWKS